MTRKRLAKAKVQMDGDFAELIINWEAGDGTKMPAFEYGGRPIKFRRVKEEWRIDANRMAEISRAADFFEKGTLGPVLRDQVKAMDEAIMGIEKGILKTGDDVKSYLDKAAELLRSKHSKEHTDKEKPKQRDRE